MHIGQALRALKDGCTIRREIWPSEFIFLLPGGTVPKKAIHDPTLRAIMDSEIPGDTFEAMDSIRMFTANKQVLTGWTATTADLLATDWKIMGIVAEAGGKTHAIDMTPATTMEQARVEAELLVSLDNQDLRGRLLERLRAADATLHAAVLAAMKELQ